MRSMGHGVTRMAGTSQSYHLGGDQYSCSSNSILDMQAMDRLAAERAHLEVKKIFTFNDG
jgi:hypothetical protein